MIVDKKEIKIRKIKKTEIKPIANFLAEVFWNNPIYTSIFPAKNKRQGLVWIFKKYLLLFNKKHNVYVAVDKKTKDIENTTHIIGTYSFIPPDGSGATMWDYLKSGIFMMPFLFGFKASKLMLHYMRTNDAEINSVFKSSLNWYLGIVAVSPNCRNQGIASYMLENHFSLKYKNDKYPVLLTTQLASNVRLYQRLGFMIIKESMIGYRKKTIQNWVMIKKV